MPRSKLGLGLSVEQLCKKERHNPTIELIRALAEKDDVGKYKAPVKDRIMGNIALMNRIPQSAPIKSKEAKLVSRQDPVKIIRQTFTLPESDIEDADNNAAV